VFEGILTRLGPAPTYERALILGRLGRCLHLGGRPDSATHCLREALDVIGKLAPSDGVKRLRGTLRSELGDALRASGRYGEARKAYEAGLRIAEELNDLRGQGIELARLGALALAEGNLEGASTWQQSALRLFQKLSERDMEATACHQLGRIYHQQGRWDEAERHYRDAARINEDRGRLTQAAQTWHHLADLLQNQPGRLAEARQLAEQALTVAQHIDPTSVEAWRVYGVLAEIAAREAESAADNGQKIGLQAQSREYRELHRHAPVLSAALGRVGESPSYARAVILGQLGRSFRMGSRPDLACAFYREAIDIASGLPASDGLKGLCGAMHADLGEALQALARTADADVAFDAALRIAEELQDAGGQARASARLGRALAEQPQSNGPDAFQFTLYDDLATDFVLETDLLVDGPRQRRITSVIKEVRPLPDGARPVVRPSARTWVDDEGAVRFSLPLAEPVVEQHPGCTVIQRTRRELVVAGSSGLLWQVIREADGAHTVAEILATFPSDQRHIPERLLAALAAAEVLDVSERPIGRFVHMTTKKGVLPAGGLEGDAVLRLATDGDYRRYPNAPWVAVSEAVPRRLRDFHALTRARRSNRNYGGTGLSRADFDALLHTACGVTGAMPWAEREVKLRAYPSSGALYAVEIYPVVLRVEGLDPGVYHYRAVENQLEVVRAGLDPASVVTAALPVEREMVAGAAALLCLTGCFPRHERKYGEGGYRMLVAEAGHISQNLILAATALGLSARPFGGVFDDLLNDTLGLDTADEQFLLAVLVGHAAR
jgi:SagB-type dehydrogenase family enzyme